jgi:putative FmdB family regulatory protein
MPTYEFECEVCGHRHTTVMKMSEYDAYPKVCKNESHGLVWNATAPSPCNGSLIQVYDNRDSQNFILAGSGWTPKFGPVHSVDTRFKKKG